MLKPTINSGWPLNNVDTLLEKNEFEKNLFPQGSQNLPRNHSRSVYALGLELLHDIQKVIVNLGLVAKFVFHLVQVRESILNFKPLKLGIRSRAVKPTRAAAIDAT